MPAACPPLLDGQNGGEGGIMRVRIRTRLKDLLEAFLNLVVGTRRKGRHQKSSGDLLAYLVGCCVGGPAGLCSKSS